MFGPSLSQTHLDGSAYLLVEVVKAAGVLVEVVGFGLALVVHLLLVGNCWIHSLPLLTRAQYRQNRNPREKQDGGHWQRLLLLLHHVATVPAVSVVVVVVAAVVAAAAAVAAAAVATFALADANFFLASGATIPLPFRSLNLHHSQGVSPTE